MTDDLTRKNAYLYCKFRDDQFASYDAYAKKHGMLLNTFLVYNALFYAKEGLNQNRLCLITRNSKQNVSLIIKNLLAEGHITLQPNPSDKRSKLISLTEKGRAYCGASVRHITLAEDAAMAMFTPKEQEALITLSRRFTQRLLELVEKEDIE